MHWQPICGQAAPGIHSWISQITLLIVIGNWKHSVWIPYLFGRSHRPKFSWYNSRCGGKLGALFRQVCVCYYSQWFLLCVSFHNIVDWTRLSCFGHNLDLCINKAIQLDRVQRELSQCHSLISVFNRSWKKNKDLHEKQIQLGLKQQKLISDFTTRWGSTFQMIDRILEQQKAIYAILADDHKNWHRLHNVNRLVFLSKNL